MAIYYTDRQKDEIRAWLLELREVVTPDGFAPNREQARELVRRLDRLKFEPTSIIDDEFRRLQRIWRWLEAHFE